MTKILVVDDAPEMRELITTALHAIGVETVVAEDGQQGVNQLTRHPEVQLVISDYNMPDMDGLTMIRTMRTLPLTPPPRCLMVTGDYDKQLAREAKALGIIAWVIKPIQISTLQAMIKKLLTGPDSLASDSPNIDVNKRP